MRALVAIGATLALAGSAASAPQTFPGKNGLIAYVKRTQPCIGHECATSIWVSALDGSNAKRLTPVKGKSQVRHHPTWSPDGMKIAYLDNTHPRRYVELWVMSADGTGKKKVAGSNLFRPPYPYFRPTWTADGKALAFVLAESGVVLAVDVETRRVRELFRLPRYTQAMQLSPDGRLVAYTTQGTQGDVFVQRVAGGGKRRVAKLSVWGWNDNFTWAPDSTRLVLLGDGDQRPVIVSASGGPPREVLRAEDRTGDRWERPIWSPDGKLILSQVRQYPDPGGANRSIIEWDRFRTIPAAGGKFDVVGPGVGSCRTTSPDPEGYGRKVYPCDVYEPSWQPRT